MQPAYFYNGSKPIQSWVYQLQGAMGRDLNLSPIIRSTADLAVIDYSRSGSEKGEFTRAEIRSLRKSGKVTLGYMPIGQRMRGDFMTKV
ncbi:MAG: hypothetical protein HC781_08415 [Leptolyngbyaceae cyanobacterium CSU_1_4]|nr:hypothetical protein [Leptolyngbyaceae cyanobacterium CSU_1_4]